VQLVKLDRAVIDGMGRDQEDPARARELIEQVHRFKIPVLAEAVETAEEAAALKDLGCDLAQGYFFGRPQPLEAFLTLVEGQAETGPDGDEAPAPAPAEEPAKAAAKPRPARRRRRAKRA
jgi:EAL domain-containing protein (putative c-di-GMP-specific phosphodiesterase class I)